jgi:hypothetical protein
MGYIMAQDDSLQTATVDPQQAELLQALLRERDLPCPLCTYNLRNLTGTRCPECGGALKLQVGLVEPRLAAYVTLLTGCCVGLGGSALFTMVAFRAAPLSWWQKTPAITLLIQLLMTGVLLPVILARRAQFRRASVARQRALAAALWLLVALLSAAFVVTFKD